MANEPGEILRIDPASGAELARHATAERISPEGFVLVDGVVYAASHSGLISAVDLASGDVEQIARLSTAPVLAGGAAFGDLVGFRSAERRVGEEGRGEGATRYWRRMGREA